MPLPTVENLTLRELTELGELVRNRVSKLHLEQQQQAQSALAAIDETDVALTQLLGPEWGDANLLSLRGALRLDRDTYTEKQDVVIKVLHQALVATAEQTQRVCVILRTHAERLG